MYGYAVDAYGLMVPNPDDIDIMSPTVLYGYTLAIYISGNLLLGCKMFKKKKRYIFENTF